jgi:arylsulfatase
MRTLSYLLLFPLAVLGLSYANLAAADQRPNVVVILVDDMGFSDIGCYGSEIATPNLDNLAKNGVRFSQCYNTGRCSPTRAALMTGLYPHQAGMGNLDDNVVAGHAGFQGKLADTCVTMAQVLKDAGYFTAMTGKWHMGQQHGTPPWESGFTRSLSLKAGGIYFYNQVSKKDAKLFLNSEEKKLDDPQFGQWYGTDLWTDYGLKFIDEAKQAKRPFFLYIAHVAPHFPLMAPQADIDRYRGKYMVGWDKLREQRYKRQIEMGLVDAAWPLTDRPESTPAWDTLSAEEKDRYDHLMAIYAATVDVMDRNIGKLVNGLRERKELDNTIIVFLSDNGGNAESGPKGKYNGPEQSGGPNSDVFIGECWATLNNTPFRKWKHYVHEGGTATPLIAHWPNGIASTRYGVLETQPAHVIDIMPTVLAVTEATYPKERKGVVLDPYEGVNLLPAIRGEALNRTLPIFFNHEDNRAVRDGNWKLVSLKGKSWELYDMQKDRTEMNDVVKNNSDVVTRLSKAYDDWAVRTRVVVPGLGVDKKKEKKK